MRKIRFKAYKRGSMTDERKVKNKTGTLTSIHGTGERTTEGLDFDENFTSLHGPLLNRLVVEPTIPKSSAAVGEAMQRQRAEKARRRRFALVILLIWTT
jgi:hypothetical protein